MLRIVTTTLFIMTGLLLCYFTGASLFHVIDSQSKSSTGASSIGSEGYRVVLITQELETPFWNDVGAGAKEKAQLLDANIEIWGSYGKNEEEFLKAMEIAIDSKVDGIIVQGLDNERFSDLTKIKAAFNGIPIITVANDVPVQDSLRRTYVGSNQVEAGKLIASQLVQDLKGSGQVILLTDQRNEYYQQQRIAGMMSIFKQYPNMKPLIQQSSNGKEQIAETTKQLLNQYPRATGFIVVNANFAGTMVDELEQRARVAPYFVYTFDDGADSERLLSEGKLDGVIQQSPGEMGKQSVSLLIDWLEGKRVPLDVRGYSTGIAMIKAVKSLE